MLVEVGERAELTAAEREFVECLRRYPITGLALIDLRIGDNGGTRRIDAVVWTPQGMTVFEVVGFRSRQAGVLDVRTEGPWKIGQARADIDAAPGVSPTDRLQIAVSEVRQALERALHDPGHICGAIALMAFRGAALRPARSTLRPGLDVVVCNVTDATEMRIYLESFAPGPVRWTAGRVLGAVKALGADGITRADLLAAGFAEKLPEPVADKDKVRVDRTPEHTRGQTTAGWAVVVTAVLGMLVVLGVILSALSTDRTRSEPAATTTSTESTSPAPHTAVECWPLQQDC
ncbi:nuclease-related domain-containing protein [Nocardia donostiensis]|uniref:NERD domain-containing protein n=1 Tax=Nocardia donostiensis TaxID=1538463 RepID=A0A1W0AXZ7_9NOCA|nr:nuclease-related domain-containing protein [Nocardia donostiensis]ONM47576.1 hypothetical protein B0T46_16890 [Nocardia donostiensis]OQS15080.1 hypothetical protein B0T36_10410 [Nocardia donostiensis]OQS24253.1 hypothetical protein B0T44_01145 [Nocardia donostiensis]